MLRWANIVASLKILNTSLNYHNSTKSSLKITSVTDTTAPDSNLTEEAAKVGDENCCCNNDSKQSVWN